MMLSNSRLPSRSASIIDREVAFPGATDCSELSQSASPLPQRTCKPLSLAASMSSAASLFKSASLRTLPVAGDLILRPLSHWPMAGVRVSTPVVPPSPMAKTSQELLPSRSAATTSTLAPISSQAELASLRKRNWLCRIFSSMNTPDSPLTNNTS